MSAESPCVRAMLVLSRKALGHILATFLPSGLFVAVSWASLFWPSDVIPGRTMVAPKNGPAMEYNNNALLDRLHLYEEKLERTIRIFIPFVFLLFNLIYWPYYLI
ncbi:hypothetical protein Hamer_G002184 [Homarus americanus]|uniref:Uncharacterized protein n=1 Tax=Homarus americanus TaxID=6706 RepID=A0A8J5JX90_HOMAM|nr:hypothetical protein Hamer_G002184 [Homarus americanus]